MGTVLTGVLVGGGAVLILSAIAAATISLFTKVSAYLEELTDLDDNEDDDLDSNDLL